MAPKQVMSAMINCPNPGSWEIPFEGYTHLMQLFADLRRMRRSVLSHPLCRTFAAALRTAAVPEGRAVSLCLGHLDDCALAAARTALHAADCTTGLTINDSLFVSRRCPLPPAALVSAANAAASHALSFPVTFSFLPHLTKPTDPTPNLASLTSALTNADPSPPASGRSTPTDPDDSRPASASMATPENSLPDNTPSPPLSPNSDPPSDLDSNLPSDYSDYSGSLPYNSPPHPTTPSGTPTSPSQPPTGDDSNSDCPSPSFSPSRSASPVPPLPPLTQHGPPPTPLPLDPQGPLNLTSRLAVQPAHAPTPHRLPPPIGLASDDPHLQHMIGFRARATTRFAWPRHPPSWFQPRSPTPPAPPPAPRPPSAAPPPPLPPPPSLCSRALTCLFSLMATPSHADPRRFTPSPQVGSGRAKVAQDF